MQLGASGSCHLIRKKNHAEGYERSVDKVGYQTFNTPCGYAVRCKIKLFLDHIMYLFHRNKEAYDKAYNSTHKKAQDPSCKIKVSGGQGTGK